MAGQDRAHNLPGDVDRRRDFLVMVAVFGSVTVLASAFSPRHRLGVALPLGLFFGALLLARRAEGVVRSPSFR